MCICEHGQNNGERESERTKNIVQAIEHDFNGDDDGVGVEESRRTKKKNQQQRNKLKPK